MLLVWSEESRNLREDFPSKRINGMLLRTGSMLNAIVFAQFFFNHLNKKQGKATITNALSTFDSVYVTELKVLTETHLSLSCQI